MGDTSAAHRDPEAPPRRARTITIVAIVTVLVLAAGWVVLAFTDESDNSPTDAVSESTLPGYPTRGPRADLDDQRALVAAADLWREDGADDGLEIPDGQVIELLWAGDVDSLALGSVPGLRSSFSARLVILRSDNAVAALARPLDGAGSDDETAFTMLGASSITTSRYERGFTVARGVLLFHERMQRGMSLETATFSTETEPALSETPTSDGLLLLSARALLRIPDAGGTAAADVYAGFAYVHPSSGLTMLQTEDADRDWSAVTDPKRGNARFAALSRAIITARDEQRGYRLRASILEDQPLPSGERLALASVSHLESQGRGSGILWAAVIAVRGDEDPIVLGAGDVAKPVNGAPQLPVIAARWVRDDGVDVLVVAGTREITSFDIAASGGTTSFAGSGGVVDRSRLALTWEDEAGNAVSRPALVVIGMSGAGPVPSLEPVS
ncbi:hypothetical protein [Pseudoclavibacter sp. RFBG4]|uniref:hypothetical protein n=1 Tax=Pseudoclavibacter sp. RFBG4 TaxID=2080575 RepID=UPI0011B0B42B|nr:hypothetical protein [Pseudoclavibacter sp. RFBG4]